MTDIETFPTDDNGHLVILSDDDRELTIVTNPEYNTAFFAAISKSSRETGRIDDFDKVVELLRWLSGDTND